MLTAISLAIKALGWTVLAFLVASLIPWLRDVWLTRHLPPFIPAPPFLGDLPFLKRHGTHRLFAERSEKYRIYPAFRVFVGSFVWVVTADPESSRRLMHRLTDRFPFPQIGREALLGERRDLLVLKGSRWRRMRAAWGHAFTPAALAQYAPLMDSCARKLCARLDPSADTGEECEVWRLIGQLTLDVVGTTAFGVAFDALGTDGGGGAVEPAEEDEDQEHTDSQRLIRAARQIFSTSAVASGSPYQALATMFPLGFPVWRALAAKFPDAKLRQLNAARRVVYGAAVELVRRHRRHEGEQKQEGAPILPGSFLAHILRAHEVRPGSGTEGEAALPPLGDADAASQATLFLLAGFETAANSLACCIYSLSTSPAAQRRLHAEVDAFFASQEDGRGAALTPEAVSARFPYADACIKEALRLYAPVTAIVRQVSSSSSSEEEGDPHAFRSDLLLQPLPGGMAPPSLRPGILIAAANLVYQTSADHWPRAGEFLPERWIPEERGGAASILGPATPAAWSPFGGGPRQCIGVKFAMLEAVIALARLFERFEFSPGPSQEVPLPMKQALTLSPDGGVKVVVRRRRAA